MSEDLEQHWDVHEGEQQPPMYVSLLIIISPRSPLGSRGYQLRKAALEKGQCYTADQGDTLTDKMLRAGHEEETSPSSLFKHTGSALRLCPVSQVHIQ